MRCRLLSLAVCLAVASLLRAAPAPIPKPPRGPEQAQVFLTGWLSEVRLTGRPPVIARQSDYQAVAKALGIQDPPAVNFRTHFLFVDVSPEYPRVSFVVDGAGDLHAVPEPHLLGQFGGLGALSSYRYLIQSFPRSAVKTVNGLPLPKR
jgi:hypothetical protein